MDYNRGKIAFWSRQQLPLAKALMKADKKTVAAIEAIVVACEANPALADLFVDGQPHLDAIKAALDFVRG